MKELGAGIFSRAAELEPGAGELELAILTGAGAQIKNQKEPELRLTFKTGDGTIAICEVVKNYDTRLQQWICKPLMFPWFNHR